MLLRIVFVALVIIRFSRSLPPWIKLLKAKFPESKARNAAALSLPADSHRQLRNWLFEPQHSRANSCHSPSREHPMKVLLLGCEVSSMGCHV